MGLRLPPFLRLGSDAKGDARVVDHATLSVRFLYASVYA